ncbi:MAG: hypothetical protein HGA67_01365 [Candidatus Yonathbacteria bacterium]|nr:hypothetical protein [Candidatus Yonathbacteria bacterium]
MYIEMLISILSGLVSSFLFSIFFYFYEKNRWGKAQKYFQRKNKDIDASVTITILECLNIDPLDDREDTLKSPDTILEEIGELYITDNQLYALYRRLFEIQKKMESLHTLTLQMPFANPKDLSLFENREKILHNFLLSAYFSLPFRTDDTKEEIEKMRKTLSHEIASIFKLLH